MARRFVMHAVRAGDSSTVPARLGTAGAGGSWRSRRGGGRPQGGSSATPQGQRLAAPPLYPAPTRGAEPRPAAESWNQHHGLG